jgi:hypothetical protein
MANFAPEKFVEIAWNYAAKGWNFDSVKYPCHVDHQCESTEDRTVKNLALE